MRRLTIRDGEILNYVNKQHNDCYLDSKKNACIRRIDGKSQDLRSFIKGIWCRLVNQEEVFPDDDEEFDDFIDMELQDDSSVSGLVAFIYQQMYTKADLHATLKYYEDMKERQNKELIEKIVDFITEYDTTIKQAIILKDRELLEQCVKEWVTDEVQE